LWGVVPISESQLRAIWDVLSIEKGPESAWHRLSEFTEFKIVFDVVKFFEAVISDLLVR
jgi:hypothetical protein